MSTREKLKSIKAACLNIWFEKYFVFDPGQPSNHVDGEEKS